MAAALPPHAILLNPPGSRSGRAPGRLSGPAHRRSRPHPAAGARHTMGASASLGFLSWAAHICAVWLVGLVVGWAVSAAAAATGRLRRI